MVLQVLFLLNTLLNVNAGPSKSIIEGILMNLSDDIPDATGLAAADRLKIRFRVSDYILPQGRWADIEITPRRTDQFDFWVEVEGVDFTRGESTQFMHKSDSVVWNLFINCAFRGSYNHNKIVGRDNDENMEIAWKTWKKRKNNGGRSFPPDCPRGSSVFAEIGVLITDEYNRLYFSPELFVNLSDVANNENDIEALCHNTLKYRFEGEHQVSMVLNGRRKYAKKQQKTKKRKNLSTIYE